MGTDNTYNESLEKKLHRETHNMTSTKAGIWTKDKVEELGKYLTSLSEDGDLTHNDVIAYVERINALVGNYASKVHSDAGWATETASW